MNMTYTDVTDATENMIRELFATDVPMPPAEIQVRSTLAQSALDAWLTHAKPLASGDTHKGEHDRLAELVRELPLTARVLA
ncbi:hypothetical protein ACFQAT_28325 [Undibacterium arcticum]|uniref:Uncharacterized protein n=1 Tax=Undibacterium arcticum TaxID=1762892 RepID=A0ABV7FB66_9BURK